MAIELTEQLVAAMAPKDDAVLDGRGLIKKGAFRALGKTADGTLVLGDCQGSGASPYKVSVDLANGSDRPTVRCSCPSRLNPCKHGIGLMLAFIAKGAEFKVVAAPADLMEKRAKLVEKNAKAGATDAAAGGTTAKPRTVNKAAQAKKVEQQRDALDALEKFVLDTVGTGLGGLSGKGLKSVHDQAKRMADADLQGARAVLLRLAALIAHKGAAAASAKKADDGDDDDSGPTVTLAPMTEAEKHARMTSLVTQLWVTIRRGRKVLEGKLEEGESKTESDAQVESLLGRRWQLPDLKEAGYWTTDRTLIELSHERTDDDVLDMVAVQGFLLDLGDGSIPVERTALPYAAMNSPGARLRTSRAGVLAVREAALYPGEALNRRIRWDEKNAEMCVERPRQPSDYARVHELAKPIDAAVKSFRDQLKNPLAPSDAVVLLAVGRFGLANDALVMEDAAGARVVFRDPRETSFATSANLRYAAGGYGGVGGSVAARLWFEPVERAIYAQPLALIVGETHLRLGL